MLGVRESREKLVRNNTMYQEVMLIKINNELHVTQNQHLVEQIE